METWCNTCEAVRSDICPDDIDRSIIVAHVADVLRQDHPNSDTDATLWAEDILNRYPYTAIIAAKYATGHANRAWLEGSVAYAVTGDAQRDALITETAHRLYG
jgi:hypothetical protein